MIVFIGLLRFVGSGCVWMWFWKKAVIDELRKKLEK
jgi:hypothetical protein